MNSDKQMLIRLYRLASFLGSTRFLYLYRDEKSRFTNKDNHKLFSKIRKDLLFQLIQSIHYRRLSLDRARDIETASGLMAKQLWDLAREIEAVNEHKITLKEKQFTIPNGIDKLKLVKETFGFEQSQELCRWISNRELSNMECLKFGAVNSTAEIGKWVTTIDTLSNRTGFVKYEHVLSKLFSRKEYFNDRGYPHDILCHDRVALANNDPDDPYICIVVKKEYVSSAILKVESSEDSRHLVFAV